MALSGLSTASVGRRSSAVKAKVYPWPSLEADTVSTSASMHQKRLKRSMKWSAVSPNYADLQPPAYADSTILAIAVAWKRWTQFCQKVFEETDHFTTADPVEVCKRHMHYEVARSFLDFSCEESSFGTASSLFTHAKTWRMGVHLHTHYPVDQTVKMDMKNHIMNTLIEEYELDEMAKFRKVLNSVVTFGEYYRRQLTDGSDT